MKDSKLLYQNLYKAYWSARKNKRTKPEQLKFELNYEENLYNLYQEIIKEQYKPQASRVFVTRKPVDREIFAPQFRDRVVHHLVYRYIYKYLDAKFIYDSYSCRENRGTLFGISRAQKFMRKATHNYTRDAYVLKLDISGYFMNINRNILYEQVQSMINYKALDITKTEQEYLAYLIKCIILHDPATGVEYCSPRHYWKTIPASKSLFHTAENCGLPIGSLTSQLFSNVYMNDVDHKIKSEFKYYGRYVDDMLLIDPDKNKLLKAIPKINRWLNSIELKIHPKKIYLQHYEKGFYFLGQYIKPYCTYISNRVKKHMHNFIEEVKELLASKNSFTLEELAVLENHFNSYFSVMSKASTYNYVHHIVNKLPSKIHCYADFIFIESKNQMKMELKPNFRIKNNYAATYRSPSI